MHSSLLRNRLGTKRGKSSVMGFSTFTFTFTLTFTFILI